MASQIDPTVFPDNELVDKADLRNQFQIAKQEITALQVKSSFIRQAVYLDIWFDNI